MIRKQRQRKMRDKLRNNASVVLGRTRSEQVTLRSFFSPDVVSIIHQPALASNLGWKVEGIVKGSFAAKIMSKETRSCGEQGGLRKMKNGGICASLQSIGSTGEIKAQANQNLTTFQERAGDLLLQYRKQRQVLHPLIVLPAAAANKNDASEFELPAYFTRSQQEVAMVEYQVVCAGQRRC